MVDCDGKPIPGAGVFIDAATQTYHTPLDFILRTDSKGEWSVRIPYNRGIYTLAAWTTFANDDEYTENYRLEGDVYVSKLCVNDGYFKVNIAEYELTGAVANNAYGLSRLTFYGTGYSVVVNLIGFSIGNTLPEGTFTVEAWMVIHDNFVCGNDEEHPATLKVKKLDKDRYEFNVTGDMIYLDLATQQETGVYPCSVYYKSKEYRGPGKIF